MKNDTRYNFPYITYEKWNSYIAYENWYSTYEKWYSFITYEKWHRVVRVSIVEYYKDIVTYNFSLGIIFSRNNARLNYIKHAKL